MENASIAPAFGQQADKAQPAGQRLENLSGKSLAYHQGNFVAAIIIGDLQTVRTYVEIYADALTYFFDQYGQQDTALHIAAKNGRTEVIAYLAGKGANLNSYGPNDVGDTPAEAAALFIQENAVLHLLDLGARPTPELLMYSANKSLLKVVERLLDEGLSANLVVNDSSVLMAAARVSTAHGEAPGKVVDLLLKRGADPLYENARFETAVTMALSAVNAPLAAKLERAQREAREKSRDAVFSQPAPLRASPRLPSVPTP